MVKEILVKVAGNVLANLQVFFGKRDTTESLLLRIGAPVYRFVEGTEENLIVSSKGVILRRYPRSNRWGGRKEYYQVVNPGINNSGYVQVSCKPVTKLVHQLVAEAFLDKPEGSTEVDHINHNKQDNRLENLRWVSHTENMSNVVFPKSRKYKKNIVAVNATTGEEVKFKLPKDIIPFAEERKWGKGWKPRVLKAIENGEKAYGFYWSGQD